MATPTPTQRAKTVLETIANRTLTNAEAQRVTTAFYAAYAPSEDQANATADQKAKRFLEVVRNFVRTETWNVELTADHARAQKTIIPPDMGADE